MYRTFRLYGKALNTWTHTNEKGYEVLTQVELAYKEYETETGEFVATGSEDFSSERYNILKKAFVYTWDGKRRNSGGKRWFENRGYILFNSNDRKAIKEYFKKRYSAELVEIRTF